LKLERGVRQRRKGERHFARADLRTEIGQGHLDRRPRFGATERPDERFRIARSFPLVDLAHLARDFDAGELGGRHAAAPDEALPQLRTIGDGVADEGAGSERGHEPSKRARILAEGAHVDTRRAEPRQPSPEIARGLLGIRGVDKGVEEGGAELGKTLAGDAAEQIVGAACELSEIAPELGGSCRSKRPLDRFAERHRIGLVELPHDLAPAARRERQRHPFGQEARQPRRHLRSRLHELAIEIFFPRIAERAGEALLVLGR
jgi:hypothetical protein